jgi:hypothetical protein
MKQTWERLTSEVQRLTDDTLPYRIPEFRKFLGTADQEY